MAKRSPKRLTSPTGIPASCDHDNECTLSGRSPTRARSASWNTTGTWSAVSCTSNSRWRTPRATADSSAGKVFSGNSMAWPRCAMICGSRLSLLFMAFLHAAAASRTRSLLNVRLCVLGACASVRHATSRHDHASGHEPAPLAFARAGRPRIAQPDTAAGCAIFAVAPGGALPSLTGYPCLFLAPDRRHERITTDSTRADTPHDASHSCGAGPCCAAAPGPPRNTPPRSHLVAACWLRAADGRVGLRRVPARSRRTPGPDRRQRLRLGHLLFHDGHHHHRRLWRHRPGFRPGASDRRVLRHARADSSSG